jgi:hypothetical protein
MGQAAKICRQRPAMKEEELDDNMWCGEPGPGAQAATVTRRWAAKSVAATSKEPDMDQ